MNLTQQEVEHFGSKLSSLGGRVSYDKVFSDRYIDIEQFFLDATKFVFAGPRLAICIENWIHAFGFIISPSKVKRLIEKEGYLYDPAVLGVFLDIIEKTNKKQLNLEPLRKFIHKKKKLHQRSSGKTKVNPSYHDKIWKKYNIATPTFHEEYKKNLLNFNYIIENIPEIGNRIKGLDILDADYQAFKAKEKDDGLSLNEISKRIHAHYSNLHKVHKRLEFFKLINQY